MISEEYSDFKNLLRAGRILDGVYIPSRYPNGLDGELAPTDFYNKGDAEECIQCATSILDLAKKYWKE